MLAMLARLLVPGTAVTVPPPQTSSNRTVVMVEDEAACFGPDCRKGVLFLTGLSDPNPEACHYPALLFGDEIGPFDWTDSVTLHHPAGGLYRSQDKWRVTGHFVDHEDEGGLLYANSGSTPNWEVVVDREMILRDSRQTPLMLIRPSPAMPRAFEIIFARGYVGWQFAPIDRSNRMTWVEAIEQVNAGHLPKLGAYDYQE